MPELVNPVFLWPVHATTRFRQVFGRATRRCADLVGPGQRETTPFVVDVGQDRACVGPGTPGTEGSAGTWRGKRLCDGRLGLPGEPDTPAPGGARRPPRSCTSSWHR